MLLSIIESLWLQIGPLLTRIPVSRAVEESADAHKLLMNALERHDPIAARRAPERDVTELTERVLGELARQKGDSRIARTLAALTPCCPIAGRAQGGV